MSRSNSNLNGDDFLAWSLFLTFLVLKLTGVVNWSWWWVAAPLWIPVGTAVVILFAIGVIRGIARAINR